MKNLLQLKPFTEIIQKLILNLYVDDSTNTFNRVEDAIEFYKKSKSALADANFNLRKWATNSKKIQNFIDNQFEEDKTSECTHRKVIGLCHTLEPTKRNILGIQGMFYDPLGSVSPITLPIKFILQKIFKLKFEWDGNIDTDTSHLWKQYIKGLKHVSSVSVNRHVLCCKHSFVQLHGFCDSSEKAYCAVVYAWVLCSHGVKVTSWSGRSRVASTKSHSIPRLELIPCALLGRLMTEVKKAIEKDIVVTNENVFCWSDSMVSLSWIKQVSKKMEGLGAK